LLLLFAFGVFVVFCSCLLGGYFSRVAHFTTRAGGCPGAALVGRGLISESGGRQVWPWASETGGGPEHVKEAGGGEMGRTRA